MARIAGFALVACLCSSMSVWGQTKPASSPPKSAAPIDVEAYKTVLDATQKSAQSAVESIKTSSDLAIKASEQSANRSIAQADKTLSALTTAFTWGGSVVLAVLGFGAFMGYKTQRDVVKQQKAVLDALRTRFEETASQEIKKATGQVELELQQTRERLLKTEGRLGLVEELIRERARWIHNRINLPDKLITAVADRAVKDLLKIAALAEKLNDKRSWSYAQAELALVSYQADRLAEAVGYGEKSVQENPEEHADRWYNLACYLEKYFQVSQPKDIASRKRATEALETYLAKPEAQATLGLKDKDLRSLLLDEVAIFGKFVSAFRSEVIWASQVDQAAVKKYLDDETLAWVYQKDPNVRAWITTKLDAA